MRRYFPLLMLAVVVATVSGCQLIQDIATSATTFKVEVKGHVTTTGQISVAEVPMPNMPVRGYVTDVYSNTYGLYTSYIDRTLDPGWVWINFRYVNAQWHAESECLASPPSIYDGLYVSNFGTIRHHCHDYGLGTLPPITTHFAIAGNTPFSFTVGGIGLSSQNGMPTLNIYNRWSQVVNKVSAFSVAPDGSSATFAFPTQSNGSPLYSDAYGISLSNWDVAPQTYCEPQYDEWGDYIGDYCWEEPGEQRLAGINYFAIGGVTSLPSPFGVDGTIIDVQGTECYSYGDPYYAMSAEDVRPMMPAPGDPICTDYSYSDQSPVVTLNSVNQLYYQGMTLGMGAAPTVVKAYATQSATQYWGDYYYEWGEETTTRPTRAVVINGNSNSVSIVDLVGWQVLANVSVPAHPAAIALSSDETRAFVTSYDAATVSEISLSSYTVTRTVGVGSYPSAITLAPSANALWIAGQGWMSYLDIPSFSVGATFTVNGTVTSMGASAGDNSIVYTAVTNASTPHTTYGARINYPEASYSVRKVRLADMYTSADLPEGGATVYGYSASGYSLPLPSLLAGGTRVSVDFGNGISVSATPDGFVVMDVAGGNEVMRGTTPTPVRAIAADPRDSVAYITLPDSNILLTVPLHQ
jgi:YVTN family beta-propeller protein